MIETILPGQEIRFTHYTGRVVGELVRVVPCKIAQKTKSNPAGVVQDLSRIIVRLYNPNSKYTPKQAYLLGEFKEARTRRLEVVDMAGNYFLMLDKRRRAA